MKGLRDRETQEDRKYQIWKERGGEYNNKYKYNWRQDENVETK